MRTPTRYNWIGAALVVVGFVVIGFASSWWAAMAVFAMIYGNNIDQASDKLEMNRLKSKIYDLMGKGK